MAEVVLQIAGRSYVISAREEDTAHLRHLETVIGGHAEAAQRAAGNASGERTLMYLALILADALDEANAKPQEALPPVVMERLAERLETIADLLEAEATLPLEEIDATA